MSHDHLLKLDQMFQDFFRHLDATVGKDNYIAVLTADHGFMPAPEVSRARGLEGDRLSASQTLGASTPNSRSASRRRSWRCSSRPRRWCSTRS